MVAARDDDDEVLLFPSTTAAATGTSLATTDAGPHPVQVVSPAAGEDPELHNLLLSLNLGIVLLDSGANIQRFTPAATGLFSFRPTDIGRPIADLCPKFHDPSFLADVLAVLDGGEPSQRAVLSHDGHWYLRRVLPHRRGDGTTQGAIATFTEVASDALQEARLYAMAIVNAVRDPLMVVDARLRVHSINQPFSDFFRVGGDDVIGRPLAEVCDGLWNVEALQRLLPRVLDDGFAGEAVELSYESQSGVHALLVRARPLQSADRRADLILLSIDDVTEQRRVEALLERAEARRNQEEHSRQRRIDLSNSLRVSTVGELATGLSHVLNQPLVSISNVVEACTRYVQSGTIEPTKLLELLDSISNDSMRAAGIVAQLRAFVDKGVPRLEIVDIVDIVRRTPHLLDYELERTRIDLRFELPDEELLVRADSTQVEHVLLNLLQNAIDGICEEADPAERRIDLQVRSTRRQAEVTVRDTGAGMSAASAARLFEPFFTTKKGGLGMGLALSRSILEAHRGRIWIEVPPVGTPGAIVHFALPLAGKRRGRELRA